MHGLGHLLAGGNGMHDGTCAVGHVAGREHTGTGGVALLVDGDHAAALLLQVLGGVDDVAAELLADGDNDAGAGINLLRAGDRAELALFVKLVVGEDNAVVEDLHRGLHHLKLHALELCVAGLVVARGDLVAAVENRDIVRALADGGPGAVHGGVAGADDDDALTHVEGLGACQVVDGKGHMAQGLALDVQGLRTPETGADEDALVAVAEQVIQADRAADGGVGAKLDALELQVAVGDVVKHGVGKAKVRDAVAHDAADLVLAVKDRDIVTVAVQDDGDGDARGAGADDGDLAPVGGGGAGLHLVCIGGGDVVFDDGEMHRHILDTADAVPLALLFVIADDGADGGERIVLKEHPARVVQLAVLQKPDDLRDVGMDRAALAASRLLAAQTAVGFLHDM